VELVKSRRGGKEDVKRLASLARTPWESDSRSCQRDLVGETDVVPLASSGTHVQADKVISVGWEVHKKRFPWHSRSDMSQPCLLV
jgi:hypothetical protein